MACFRFYCSHQLAQPRPNHGVTQWSPEEDARLKEAVRTEGEANWIRVAVWLEGRGSDACLQRWRYSANPSIRKGKWTAEEDELLRQGVAQHGAKGWATWVPGHMNGRTAPQSRERWVNSLDPSKKKATLDSWTAEEDEALIEAVELHGLGKWAAVQRQAKLVGRTDQHCKVRWVRHLEPTVADRKRGSGNINMPWTVDEDRSLAAAVAEHVDDGVIDWKGAHTALRTVAHMQRRTINANSDNLRTRWRKLKSTPTLLEQTAALLESLGVDSVLAAVLLRVATPGPIRSGGAAGGSRRKSKRRAASGRRRRGADGAGRMDGRGWRPSASLV